MGLKSWIVLHLFAMTVFHVNCIICQFCVFLAKRERKNEVFTCRGQNLFAFPNEERQLPKVFGEMKMAWKHLAKNKENTKL